jgi:hypothetical protein
MPRTRKGDKRPTWTHLVLRALQERDDFMDQELLLAATGASKNQLSAALIHLKRFKAVDAVESEGRLWWCATGEDTRSKALEERTPEPPGNRTRASRGPRRKPRPVTE